MDYQETYVTYTVDEIEDGKSVTNRKVLPEKKFDKLDPKPDTELYRQSFQFHEVEDIDGATTLYGPDLINIVNRGGILKQQNAVRALMLSDGDDAFEPIEGVYDLASICAEITERQKMSPVEKAAKSLAKLSQDEIIALLAKFAPSAVEAS